MRNLLFLCAAIGCLMVGAAAILGALGFVHEAEARNGERRLAEALRVQRDTVGRFRIDNPTPSMARNAMLIDTATGETWLMCGADGSVGWCDMKRGFEQAPR